MLTIESLSNPKIKEIRSLRSAGNREKKQQYFIEGRKMCLEAFRFGHIETLLVAKPFADKYEQICGGIPQAIEVSEAVMSSLCEAETPQEIAAVVRKNKALDLSALRGPVVILDGVQDPGNVGTIIRTAEAAGYSGVVMNRQCADAFSGKAVRSTMGAILREPLWRGELSDVFQILKSKGYQIICSQLDGVPLRDLRERINDNHALIIGSEGNGVSELSRTEASHHVRIDMRGQVESLNAAVAAGILMYSCAGLI